MNSCYYPCSDDGIVFSSVCLCVCLSVCQHNNSWTVRDNITKCSGHRPKVERADKLDNGYIEVSGVFCLLESRKSTAGVLHEKQTWHVGDIQWALDSAGLDVITELKRRRSTWFDIDGCEWNRPVDNVRNGDVMSPVDQCTTLQLLATNAL